MTLYLSSWPIGLTGRTGARIMNLNKAALAKLRKHTIERKQRKYPEGCRVEMVSLFMEDQQAPPLGTKGTVIRVDDMGMLHVRWDDGCEHRVTFAESCMRIDDK